MRHYQELFSLSSIIVLQISHPATTVNSFAYSRTRKSKKLQSKRQNWSANASFGPYKNDRYISNHRVAVTVSAHFNNHLNDNTQINSDAKNHRKLPPWLVVLQAQDMESKLEKLRDALGRSYLVNDQPDDVLRAINIACHGDPVKISGVAELCLPLVEDMDMGRDTIVAAAFHYSSCFAVRERMLLQSDDDDDSSYSSSSTCSASTALDPALLDESTYLLPLAGCGIEQFGEHAVKIALNTARIKRTEVVIRTSIQHYHREADNLRSLLLSVTGDWRALAIRANASLFRMRGLLRSRALYNYHYSSSLKSMKSKFYSPLLPDEIREAKEALYIYAPLAHRLGMHRLKSELEAAAFRLLYRRQYEAVWSLYKQGGWSVFGSSKMNNNADVEHMDSSGNSREVSSVNDGPTSLHFYGTQNDVLGISSGSIGEGMQAVLGEVTKRVKRRLREDDTFMNNIATVSVSARVKEPFSLWKKLLKMRLRRVVERREFVQSNTFYGSLETLEENGANNLRDLTVFDVPDACALRVVLKARTMSPNESEDVTRSRDRSLCYYVQNLCAQRWPSTDEGRSKDYIIDPKENGYQSLHYSTSMRWHGQDWPFEVQARSSDMHRVAEYGLAAHWSYKSGSDSSDATKPMMPLDGYMRSIIEARENKNGQDFLGFTPLNNYDMPSYDAFEDFDRKYQVGRAIAREEQLLPYLEALSEARKDLTRACVFVFLTSPCDSHVGSILCLPVGACVLDALREARRRLCDDVKMSSVLHTLDRRDVPVLCNGAQTSLTQRLRTGDVLSLVFVGDGNLKVMNDLRPMHV